MKNQRYIIALSLFIVSASWGMNEAERNIALLTQDMQNSAISGMNDQVDRNIALLTPEMQLYVRAVRRGVDEDQRELKKTRQA